MKAYYTLVETIKKTSPKLKRGVLVFVFFSVNLLSLLAPRPADAILDSFVDSIVQAFLQLLVTSVGALVTLVAIVINLVLDGILWIVKGIFDWVMALSLSVDYTSGSIIDSAWPVTRDIANMGLILVLVAIGIGTILNLRQGQYKKRLGAFLVVALLINFTPVITGLIIDMSNITARVFYDSAQNTSGALLSANPAQGLAASWETFTESFTWSELNIVANIVEAVSGIVFSVLLIFALILLSALFLGRIVFLWMLVILSPIAFLMYILPSTKKHFDRWWRNFLQWSIIVIPLLFFLWIAGIFANNASSICETGGVSSPDGGILYVTGESGSSETITGEQACEMVSVLMATGALMMGIMISLQSSAEGASVITQRTKQYSMMASKAAGRGIEKRAYRYGGRGATALRKSKAGQAAKTGMQGVRKTLKKFPGAKGVAKIGGAVGSGLGTVTGAKAGAAAVRRKAQGRVNKVSQEYKKIRDYDNWSHEDRAKALTYERDPEKKAKLLELLSKDSPWKLQEHYANLSEKEKENFKKEVEQRENFFPGSSQAVYNTLPQLQGKDDLENWAKRATSQQMRNLGERELADKRVVDALIKAGNFNQLANAIRNDAKKIEQLDKTLGSLAEDKYGLPESEQSKKYKESSKKEREKIREEQDKTRQRVKRKAKEAGQADFEYKDPSKGNLGGTTWEFNQEFIDKAREEMERDLRSRQAKNVPEYIKSSSPDKPTSTASHPALAAALSASRQSGALEKALDASGQLSNEDKTFIRDNVIDTVKKDIRKAFKENKEEAKKGSVQNQKAIEAIRKALTDTSNMHKISDSKIDRIAHELGPDLIDELKRDGFFSDLENKDTENQDNEE
ncbi:MAG: hypothetical protein R3346_00940 [Candidatus Spechtbacterales bacterium]|nr:hypothetical protein [Candidatus Spechtbacterales bacterium]